MIHIGLRTILLLSAAFLPSYVWADDVDTLLKSERPPGIVFEIIASDIAILDQRLPEIRLDIERLRKKFPALPIAIVSHGREQFALTRKNAGKYQTAHSLVQQLVKQDEVEVHVCGTHASWYDVTQEDFPDYVNVSATGPAQINDYEELGYELIVIDE